MKPSHLLQTSVVVGLFMPLLAGATNGYFSHGYGIKAQGLAGVGIALPQDGLAAATNPAGTAFVGDRVDLGLSWLRPDRGAELTGATNPVAGSYDGNGKKNFFIPEAGYVRQWSDSVAVGIAAYGNGGMNTQYNRNPFAAIGGVGKAGVNFEQLFISPSLAWKPTSQQAIGLSLNYVYQRFAATGLQPFTNPGFTASPADVTNRGDDTATGWGVRLGWTGQLSPALTLGATWASKINTTGFDKYRGLFADGGGFDVPENFGIGLAYTLTPATIAALDVQRIQYRDIGSVGNPLGLLATGKKLGDNGGPGFGWDNVTVVKLGVSHDYSKDFTVRAGLSHASQPIPADQTFFNVLAPGVVQDHLSLGATWRTGNGELSVAYTHGIEKTVKGSGSIPLGTLGFTGESNIRLKADVVGISYGWKL